ncbi:MAG TPA: DNA-formamidopyrimidine glycosylase family protein [Actinomycetota bacterium]|nr:DNA-formamidopyrimidine glycosylase family protein [Actinomycetota bacterium]
MPEGDTVFVAAARLRDALGGDAIVRSDLRVPSLATVDLAGRNVEDVVSRGKHLLFRFSGELTLHTHYKMDGTWHLYRPGERWRGPDFEVRAVLYTDGWVAVGFRLAVVELLARADEHDAIGHLGPDPLGDDWDPDVVESALRARGTEAIGTVLLDQRVIAGPGNVYKSEVCFLSGTHPWTPVAEVADLRRMVDLVARLMRANRTTGNQMTTGDRRPGRQRWVYGRAGKRCFRCGETIRRGEQDGYGGERVTFWCPGCQPQIGRADASMSSEEPIEKAGANAQNR